MRTVKNANFDVDLILDLIHTVVFHDPITNCYIKGNRRDWFGLPKSKSLFFAKKDRGFPIGNLTSQLFGNIYLDEFDHFVCEKIGMQHYGRYVDDMVFVHRDKEFLKSVVSKVRDYLQKELGLTVHPKKIYLQHYTKGVGFLGTFIKPWRIYIGNKTKHNFYAKTKMWNDTIEKNHGFSGEKEAKKFVACVNSYLGIMKHYDTSMLRKKMVLSFGAEILKSIVIFENFEKVKLANVNLVNLKKPCG